MSVEYTDAQLELFNQAMGIMKKELPSASYMTFFKPLKLRAVTPDALIIEGPDDFTLKNIRNRYMTMLYNVMNSVILKTHGINHTGRTFGNTRSRIAEPGIFSCSFKRKGA